MRVTAPLTAAIALLALTSSSTARAADEPAPSSTTTATPPATADSATPASAAPAAAATTTSTTTPAAPATPPAAPATTTSAPADEPKEVDGWTILSFVSGKRLPDGRATEEACGWQRDVIVEKVDAKTQKKQLGKAVLAVPCEKGDDAAAALRPGKPTLLLSPELQPKKDDTPALGELPSSTGGITTEQLQALIASHQKELDACRSPSMSGVVVVKVAIDAAGKPTDAHGMEGPLQGSDVDKCASKQIAGWSFPAPTGGAALARLPLSFGTAPASTKPAAPTCKPGEQPKKPDELAAGEVACVEPQKPRPCAEGETPIAKEQLPPGQLACVEMASDRGVPFYKGELSHLGDVQLVNARSSIGARLGVSTFDNVYYAVVQPELNVHYGPFQLGLGAPLRFQIADLSQLSLTDPSSTGTVFQDAGRFRVEDWDQVEDFLRPLRYLSWGKKEDRLYVDVNRVHALTIGHGQLVRRYSPNVDIDEDNLFASADGYTDFGGVELMAGPFPVPRLVGGLVFVKPLGLFLDDTLSKSWSIGVSYVTDLNAPTTLDTVRNAADGRVQLLVDPTNQLVFPGRNNPIGSLVQGVGLDTELKVLKLDFLDLKLYGDWSQLFFPADTDGAFDAFTAGGAALGALLRMSFGSTPVRDFDDESPEVRAGKAPREMKAAHAVRVRVEARTFDPRYLPSYFNTTYEIDRLQYGQSVGDDARSARAQLPTKIAFLAANEGEPWRAGYYLEASYAWVDWLALTAVYEDAYPLGATDKVVRARNLALHAETQGLGFLQLFMTYHYRNFDSVDGMFSFNTDNEIFYAGGRLQLLPILFVNASAQRTFRVGFLKDDLAGSPTKSGLRATSVGTENVWGGNLDVELGWQF